MAKRQREIRFPSKGVARDMRLRGIADGQGPWPSPWAANVRVYENIDRRLRGGSRPGLTKFVGDDMGTTIADLASIQTSSATGTSDMLLVLVDSTVKTVAGGTTVTPVAYLVDDSGDTLQNAAGDDIIASSGTAPASGFLVTGQQLVFAITSSAIEKIDPKTGQVNSLAAISGTVPTNCTFGAIYRDRLCLSGQDNAIYMSRQGDYGDWNFGAAVDPELTPDAGRALAFQLALASDVGDAVTALIPHRGSVMLAGTQRSLWVIAGDPAADGTLQRVSENVGILDSGAWCRYEDTVFFLGNEGLYSVQADGGRLEALTPFKIPEELRDIDTATVTVSLGYEHERRAIHIFLRTASGNDTHWVYELLSESFWPVRIPDDHSPLVTCQHQGELLLAGNDGYIRKIGGDDDDGTNIESHVLLGPVRIGQAQNYGRLLNLQGMVANGSGTVNWKIITGDTAEDAADNGKLAIEAFQAGSDYSSYVKASGAWTAGRAVLSYPRTRGIWCCLWLQSTAKWAYEGAVMESMLSGRWKGT